MRTVKSLRRPLKSEYPATDLSPGRVTALNDVTELVDEAGCEDRREGGSHKKVKHVALSQGGDGPRQPADCEATAEEARTDAAPAFEDVRSTPPCPAVREYASNEVDRKRRPAQQPAAEENRRHGMTTAVPPEHEHGEDGGDRPRDRDDEQEQEQTEEQQPALPG
jgi:hypothetical protein